MTVAQNEHLNFKLVFSQTDTTRKCGTCDLCCKLLPVISLNKLASVRCKHQKFNKGCAIYVNRPFDCSAWSCRWLSFEDTNDLQRPDRIHYVLDPMPDTITAVNNDTGDQTTIPVLQIWNDPAFPNAHRDPKLRSYLEKLDGWAGIVRYNSSDSLILIPPSMSSNNKWYEFKPDKTRGD
jgi:hypothetical protein